MRRSTSRTESTYSESRARSVGPSVFSRLLTSDPTRSRMLRSRCSRACRACFSVLPLVPNSRSKTARGSRSVGSGVVGVRQAMVLVYAQLEPPSQVPSMAFDSMPSSIDASCVSFASSRAATWSIDTDAKTSAPRVTLNGTPVRNVPAALA
jgi:hypothetical protein